MNKNVSSHKKITIITILSTMLITIIAAVLYTTNNSTENNAQTNHALTVISTPTTIVNNNDENNTDNENITDQNIENDNKNNDNIVSHNSSGSQKIDTPPNNTENNKTHIIVNQGEMLFDYATVPVVTKNNTIETLDTVACAAGYVDNDNKQVYTAAHCFNDGDIIYNKDKVRIGVANRIYKGDLFGDGTHGYPDTYFANMNDMLVVELDDNVSGENTLSGDTIVTGDSINPEDTVCTYSRMRQNIYCGSISQKDYHTEGDNKILWANVNIIHGDSGGPHGFQTKVLLEYRVAIFLRMNTISG